MGIIMQNKYFVKKKKKKVKCVMIMMETIMLGK